MRIVALALLWGLLAPAYAGGISYWDRQRKGANYFNEQPTREWFEAAAAQDIKLVRLTFAKWKGARRDFLLGDAGRYDGLVEEDLKKLIRYLDVADSLGIRVVVTPISLPGARWRQNNGGKRDGRLWREARFLNQTVRYWKDLAARLAGHPAIAAYGIVNEPHPEIFHGKPGFWEGSFVAWYRSVKGTPGDLNRFYRALAAGIREVDPDTPLVIESGLYATPWAFEYLEPLDDDKVIYSFHLYEPYDYTTRRINKGRYAYPGKVRIGELDQERYFDYDALDSFLEPVRRWAREHGLPANRIFAGEFGCDRRNEGAARYLADLIRIFNKEGWHWAFYAFREDAWQAMDYELGTGAPGWKYWQAREVGKLADSYDAIYQPRAGNPLWRVIQSEFAPQKTR